MIDYAEKEKMAKRQYDIAQKQAERIYQEKLQKNANMMKNFFGGSNVNNLKTFSPPKEFEHLMNHEKTYILNNA